MENNEVKVWKGIEFNDNWSSTDTSTFDDLAPSWYKKRKKFEDEEVVIKSFLTTSTRIAMLKTKILGLNFLNVVHFSRFF